MQSTDQKVKWVKPELEKLSVENTLSGAYELDSEAVFNGQDVFLGGPQGS